MLKIVAVAFCGQWWLNIVLVESAATTPRSPINTKTKRYYNPNLGYEPYWPQGNWVFELPRDRNLSISTTKWPTVCGEECNYLYTRIGKICAHKSDDVTYDGCSGISSLIWGCDGWTVDDLTRGFVTFDTYCQFLDWQCKSYFDAKWVFVHVGECLPAQELWFKPVFKYWQVASRLEFYLTSVATVFENFTKTPFG